MLGKKINPVRNSSGALNTAGIILKFDPQQSSKALFLTG
jgi:hypothetical protein